MTLAKVMATKQSRTIYYGIAGFLLGLFFIVLGAAAEILDSGSEPSLEMIFELYTRNPILMVMFAVPFILSLSFILISVKSIRAYESSFVLNEKIKHWETRDQNENYFLEALIKNSSFAIVRLDTNHKILSSNEAFKKLFDYSSDEMIGKHLDALISPEEYLQEATRISKAVSSGRIAKITSKRKRKDGSLVAVEVVGVPVIAAGEQIGILGLYHDISVQESIEKALIESEFRFKNLFNESPISLWEEDFSGVKKHLERLGNEKEILDAIARDDDLVRECMSLVNILDVNQATIDLYQAQSKTELLTSLDVVLLDVSLDEFRNELIALISGEQKYECEIAQKKLNGGVFHGLFRFSIPQGYEKSWQRLYISIVDITDRKRAEEKLRFLSFHDALTGLFNRAYFEEDLARLEGSRHFPVSIIACDLDNLKQINDTQGHNMGDRAIKSVAKILGDYTFRTEDVVARIGGDEFVVVLPSVDLKQNRMILERINNSIEKFNSSSINDGLYRPISLSLGSAVVQENESLVEGYKAADKAMYLNKQQKKFSNCGGAESASDPNRSSADL